MNRALLTVFIMLSFLCGCDKIPFLNNKSVKNNPPQTQSASEAKEEMKINGALLARVNDWAIGVDDFKSYLNTLKPVAEAQGINVDDQAFKSRLLQDLVRNQILAQIAIERGLDKNSDVVKALRDTKTTLLASKVASDVDKNTSVTYPEVQEWYNKNKEFLRKPEERRIREIVCSTEAEAKDANIKVLQGEDFSALAKTNSISDTKSSGGDLGFIRPDTEKRPLKFWQVAFQQLDKGGISSVFKAEDGKFYVIKVEDVKPGEAIPLTGEITMEDGTKVKVEEQIKISLKGEKAEKEVKRLTDDYKTRSKVEIKEDLLK